MAEGAAAIVSSVPVARGACGARLILLGALAYGGACAAEDAWGYRLGEAVATRQANFCDTAEAAMEIAAIFERFGPRTGFSALANSPQCSTRIHAVTPRSLLRQVPVPLESGGQYTISFIQVQADNGSEPVLVTTRRLIPDE